MRGGLLHRLFTLTRHGRRAVYFLLHCLSNADFASLQLPHPPGDYPAFFPAEPGLCLTGFLFHQKKSARLYPVCYYRIFMSGAYHRIPVSQKAYMQQERPRRQETFRTARPHLRRRRHLHRLRFRLLRQRFRRRQRLLFLRFPRLRLLRQNIRRRGSQDFPYRQV